MVDLTAFLGEYPSCSFGADGPPRKELEEIGEYYCYLCEGNFNRLHKKKLYFGYDITVCIGECDERWSRGRDKQGFLRKV